MSVNEKTVWDVIENHRESASLQSRLVGCFPTHEWTGQATTGLQGALLDLKYSFHRFYSDVSGQPLYGKMCVCFVTFGKPPE